LDRVTEGYAANKIKIFIAVSFYVIFIDDIAIFSHHIDIYTHT